MTGKYIIKITSILLLIALEIQSSLFQSIAAPEMLPLFAPENMRLEAKEQGKPAIGFISARECHIDINWDQSSISPYPAAVYYNIYIKEIGKYGISSGFILRDSEKGLPSNINDQPFRISNLKPGTEYQIQVKAYYKVAEGSTIYTSPESAPSNTITVLTDINLIVGPPSSTNEIRVEWDDVWTLNGRIDYMLYISENENYANTRPIYLTRDMIGPSGPIFVNQVTGRLEYIHPVRDPGKIYYVTLAPDISDEDICKNTVTSTQYINTFILVKTTRIANTSAGILWRLDWTPVNTGLNKELSKAYLIYKGRLGSSATPNYVASVTGDTSFFVTVPADDDTTYFKIVADIRDADTQQEVFPLRITSGNVPVREVEVPNTPSVPELVSELRDDSDRLVESFNNLLGSDTATILMKVPKKADGTVDADIEYDIWLIGDSRYIDNPPDTMKIAEAFKFNPNNENMAVRDGSGNITGYKYKLTGLTPNGTYYFRITARKRFSDFVGGELSELECVSAPAYQVVITSPEGPIDQPVVPSKPPLRVKRLNDGTDAITGNSVIIELKNKWYEKYDTSLSGWVYIDTSILSDPQASQNEKDQLLTLITSIDADTADRSLYRKIEYDEGVGIDVGCIKESELVNFNDLSRIPAEKIIDFPTIPNDREEIPDIPGDSKHNINIPITELDNNTSYVIWVKAVRRAAGSAYEPSDPIIVITKPVIPDYPEYPTVPVFNYEVASDRYVDLGWTEFKPEYTYYLAWSETDDADSAKDRVKVTAEDYTYFYYRVKNLKPGTSYYFWVRAGTGSSPGTGNSPGEELLSDWSDSCLLSTLPDLPPNPPRGFGIGNFDGAVGKNDITFEWMGESGIEYTLELASNPEFDKSEAYQTGAVSRYAVSGLRSNYRYYARLFAYDPDKKMRSEASPVITVRTERSTDDYDSDQNTEDIISDDFIEKDSVSKGRTWNIRLTGINGERFIEHVQNDNTLDYRLDARETPAYTDRISLTVSSRIMDLLGDLKENLIIQTAGSVLVIRPNMLSTQQDESLKKKLGSFDYRITITNPHQPENTTGLTFYTKASGVAIEAMDGGNPLPVNSLNNPLKLMLNYTGSWYKDGVTSGFICSLGDTHWEKCETTVPDQDQSGRYIAVESLKTGDIGVASPWKAGYDDLDGQPYSIIQAIDNVTSVHRLKSANTAAFRPSADITAGDAVKFMLDMFDYNYGSDYMSIAAKSGIINPVDMASPSAYCTREKAAAMAVRVYEIKSGNTASAESSGFESYIDVNLVDPVLGEKVFFAVRNGILPEKGINRLDPKGRITRGEVMVLLEKSLALVGELQ